MKRRAFTSNCSKYHGSSKKAIETNSQVYKKLCRELRDQFRFVVDIWFHSLHLFRIRSDKKRSSVMNYRFGYCSRSD